MTSEFVTYVLDSLAALGQVSPRRMFGCTALFHGGRMFALVEDDAVYVKVDAQSRPVFEDAGLVPLTYQTSRNGQPKTVALSYYTIPADAPADPDVLLRWVRMGLDAANRIPLPPAKRRRTPPARYAGSGRRA